MVGMQNGIFPTLILLLLAAPAFAHSPEDVDPAMAPWFQSLQSPDTGGSCCNEKDCATVADGDLKIDSGSYWVRDPAPENLMWMKVPSNHVLKRDNPTGKPVACIWGHSVACFVAAAGL